jgi:hypothetical protein
MGPDAGVRPQGRGVPEMRPTPRNAMTGLFADALTGARNFADRAQIPQGVPLVGGQGLGSLLLGQAPEELNEWSYGNAPIQINPNAGRTASFVPEIKRGRGQQVADLAALSPLPGARGALAMSAGAVADPGAAGRAIFIGPKAKTWNREAAERAAALDATGADPRSIWMDTGTFKGADGKWRQEIDDSAAALFKPQTGWESFAANLEMVGPARRVADDLRSGKLHVPQAEQTLRRLLDTENGDSYRAASQLRRELQAFRPAQSGPPEFVGGALEHPSLMSAYPDAAAIKYREGAGGVWDDSRGMYSEANDAINLNVVDQVGKKSTLLHELQHAIQQREGFARGGSPAEFSHNVAQANADIMGEMAALRKQPWTPEIGDRFVALNKELEARSADPGGAYRRLAGEAEARAVQSRMNLTPQQRRALFPLDSYDVPPSQLIVR